jgi:tRNA 2-thiouridine synthesizing protein A
MNGHGIFARIGSLLQRMKEQRGDDIAGAAKQVSLPKHGVLTIVASMDFLGMNCLRTNLLTKKALGLAAPGEILEIITDNPSSAETIPFMLPTYGCIHLATLHEEPHRIIYIKKIAS